MAAYACHSLTCFFTIQQPAFAANIAGQLMLCYRAISRPMRHSSQLLSALHTLPSTLCLSLTSSSTTSVRVRTRCAAMGTSPPPTPPSRAPTDDEWRFESITSPCEWIEDYRPGGYHPVHLGDDFHHGQYKIIRKLGDGAYSTVWLARDTRYVPLPSLDGKAIHCGRSFASETTDMLL